LAKHPTGGARPGSIEEGLRNLVLDTGPHFRKLSRADEGGLRQLMDAAQVPDGWTRDAKAAVVVTVIHEVAQQIANPRWKSAALAALRFPVDHYTGEENDSLTGRWRVLARRDGATESSEIKARIEAYRGYWVHAAFHLAAQLESRLSELNASRDQWHQYRVGEALVPALADLAPLTFDRTEVLYRFRQTVGLKSVSYRWVTAHSPVDHYVANGSYFSDPNAQTEIEPLANCIRDGDTRELPQGGRCATIRFSHELQPGERYFFAYETVFNSDLPCRPTILYEVSGREISSLNLHVQFDPPAVPARIWYFNVGALNEGWEIPTEGAPEMLTVSVNGYVGHSFERCGLNRKYGLRWIWPQGDE
jgi:hypothetical protein